MYVDGLHEKGIFADGFPFRLEINTLDNFDYPVHWHAVIEILYIEKNHFNINVNNKEFKLDEGDILFIASGDTHGFSNRNNIGKRIFIQFDSSSLSTFGNNNIIKALISSTFKISIKDVPFHESIKEHILSIVEKYSKKDFGFELFISARIHDIFAIISKFLADKINLENSTGNIRKMQGMDKLAEAFKFIEANYMNDISLSDVAKAVGFSESYFSRMFKDITEKNFILYLNEYRIKQAELFLTSSNMSISDIAYAVGFNSIVTFNRSFKSIKGCSPSLYKKIGL
ncbi:helix-turn-helix transcriptional regulator [Ruminiclostridium herbifermentans]|uniref:Helix-turn-helix transcriptional regulator n=1 Tax=Ruminiclostridium herbifermentans TaxID=2488810 RepID=A0A7H1VPA8_9FIRM|nr:AraC family transcriptional regulator [Ruminiclostridium herbifermentans]QNU67220.1 helix-turn-helix transcriptional regulator [Ruminiclostridium herbifermentans]